MKIRLYPPRGGDTPGVLLALAALLVFAPLFRGGNRPLPLAVLELAALGLLLYVLLRPRFLEHLGRPLLIVLVLLWIVPVLQLVPLPFPVWQLLSGRGFYADALVVAGVDGGWQPITLVPALTEAALLALLPPLAVFLAVVGLPSPQIRWLVFVMLGLAVFQALLGLVQYGDGATSVFRLGNQLYTDSATGTYVNRNHFGGLLAMMLPIAVALLIANIGRFFERGSGGRVPRRRPGRRKGLRQTFGQLGTLRVNTAMIYGAIVIVILLGIIFSRSRMSIALTMLGLVLCMAAYARRVGGENIFGLVGTLVTIAAMLAVTVGLAPVWGRFAQQDPMSDLRWSIFASTIDGIGRFFPLGSGYGTFPEVYPRLQTPDTIGYINHAHNDYLEWLMEGGILAAGILLALVWFYARRWREVWEAGNWSAFRFIQVGAGIGLLIMGLHGLVDFNFHIPANAVYYAFLAAVFFHRHREESSPASPSVPQAAEAEETVPKLDTQLVPPENQVNPFAE